MPRRKTKEEFEEEFYSTRSREEYELLTDYEKASIKVKVRHITCGNVWYMSPGSIVRGSKCSKRECSHVKSPDTFAKEFIEVLGSDYIQLSTYAGFNKPIKVFHSVCGEEYSVKPTGILSGTKCPICDVHRRTKSPTQYKKDFMELLGSDYVLDSEYVTGEHKVKVTHTVCGATYQVRAKNIYQGNRCPICNESKGERKISEFLNKQGIQFEPQKTFTDCRLTYALPFDFYIPDHNLLIEFDGEQHFKPIKAWGGIERYNKQVIRDNTKAEYCSEKGIGLLRIPFNRFNEIEEILTSELEKI